MEDKLHNFFSENEFDFHEPHSGHIQRFEKRLQGVKPQRKFSWKWMSVAASIILVVGFYLGKTSEPNGDVLSKISPEMEEVETYFVNTINVSLQEMEGSRSLQTEEIIEKALDRLEELEDDYKLFIKELNDNGQQRRIISQMIENYRKRLEVLENTLRQIELVKNPKTLDDEIYI
ncbi:hypothetical protein AAON49_11860 [Pseudotenacibaculum sp. MALMAid0570]|uniref:hypothetical protein n=1 Tax=Pseudotenacibaculum sp. MALMAid0570 TaxID=3143938 RepID=UPI0032DE9587